MHLSTKDLERWIDAITNQPVTPQHLLPWVETKLRAFFSFESLFMAHGCLVAGQTTTTHRLATGHTPIFLRQLSTTFELEHRGSMHWWFQNRQPFVIDPNNPPSFASRFELDEIQKFDLKNVAAHGVLNAYSSDGTYFSFIGVSLLLSNWHVDSLRLLAPVFNDLYLAYVASEVQSLSATFNVLTIHQKEIVRQIAIGHNDKTIARQLSISPKTIRNQLSAIYTRLGIATRVQLMTLLR